MRRALLIVGCAVAVVLAVVVVNAARFTSRQMVVAAAPEFTPQAGAVGRLAGAIRIRTISYDDTARRDPIAFATFRDYLAREFPRAHAALRREVVARDAMLYTWPGSDS